MGDDVLTGPQGLLVSTTKIEPKDQIILLAVKAKELFEAKASGKNTDLNDYCVLQDLDHNSKGRPLSHFTSEVYLNRNVKWEGSTADSNYYISIEKIKYESNKPTNGAKFFEKDPILGQKGSNESKHVSALFSTPDLDNLLYVYTIHFTIYRGEIKLEDFNNFEIDPKLCANN